MIVEKPMQVQQPQVPLSTLNAADTFLDIPAGDVWFATLGTAGQATRLKDGTVQVFDTHALVIPMPYKAVPES